MSNAVWIHPGLVESTIPLSAYKNAAWTFNHVCPPSIRRRPLSRILNVCLTGWTASSLLLSSLSSPAYYSATRDLKSSVAAVVILPFLILSLFTAFYVFPFSFLLQAMCYSVAAVPKVLMFFKLLLNKFSFQIITNIYVASYYLSLSLNPCIIVNTTLNK